MDNPRIIHAPINRRRYAETSPITQYDYGYLLLPEGVELPATYEIDFSNDEHKGTSLPVYGGAEGAEVPEELIRTGKDIYAFYYRVGDGYGKTEFTWRIPNHCRPSRDGQTPTPTQQSSIDQLIVRSNEAVTSAEQSASNAGQSAQNASQDAGRAERAKTDAETAQGKAEDAQESAERAKDDAETSERNASESERKAKGYSETASQKADSIHSMTAQATTLPDGSSATASYDAETGVMLFGIPKGKDGIDGDDGYSPTASVSKSGKVATITITDKNGTTSAQLSDGEDGATGATPNLTIGTVETLEPAEPATATITGTPENPVLNLGIPQGNQGEVTTEEFLKAFVTDTASGSIASFSDGADNIPLKSLVVNINPVQDLHGQDAPYPAGGGVNQWDEEVEFGLWDDTNAEWLPATLQLKSKNYIPVSPSTTYRLVNPSGTISRYVYYDTDKNYLSWVSANSNKDFTTPANAHYMMFGLATAYGTVYNHDISINYPSTDTSYHPYENICPISGWTGANVNATGINIFNGELENGNISDSSGQPSGTSASYFRSKNFIPCAPNTDYYWYSPNRSSNFRQYYYDKDKNYLGFTGTAWNSVKRSKDRACYIKFRVAAPYNPENDDFTSINYPSNVTGYVPYVGRSLPISWASEAGTVYGGKLYPLEGKAVIDRAMAIFDGSEIWSNYATRNGFSIGINDMLVGYRQNGISNYLVRNPSSEQCGFWLGVNNRTLYVLDVVSNIIAEQSTTEWMAYLAEHPLQILYPLAETIEIQLTPQQINSLLGVNNIWADTGDTEVEYRADTKLYISKKIAEAISALS